MTMKNKTLNKPMPPLSFANSAKGIFLLKDLTVGEAETNGVAHRAAIKTSRPGALH